jgi:6-phosphofructokinase 2
MPGPAISAQELNTIKNTIAGLKDVTYLVCSGSLPPGAPTNFLGQVADIAKAGAIKFVVDTSAQPLKDALEKGVYLLKPNLSELCFLVGKEYLEVSEIDEAAQKVLGTGLCEVLIISMGPGGAKLVTKKEIIHIAAPVVKKQSTVGAGDSMVAGIIWMLDQGKELKEAVQFGIACGTAATINKGTQLFKKEDALRFYDWIKNNS